MSQFLGLHQLLLTCLLLGAAPVAGAQTATQGAPPTLRSVLVETGFTPVEIRSLRHEDLDRPVTSYVTTHKTAPARAAAFYYDDELADGYLPDDFWLLLEREGSARLARIVVSDAGLRRSPGSLLRIHFTKGFLVVGGHWNPSAGPSVVIRLDDLKAVSWFTGWVLQSLRGDKCMYIPSMVHFAPTHPSRVRIRDLSSGEDNEIYPLKPETELWRKRVEYIRGLYEEWGDRLGNHHDDPTQFNLSVRDSRYLPENDTLVLILDFEASEERIGLKYEDGLQSVAVIYRRVSSEPAAEEGPLSEILKRHGAASLDELLRSLK